MEPDYERLFSRKDSEDVYLRVADSNRGPLPAQVTTENIREQRYARNPQLARVLADMKYVRELNEGVPRIFKAMRESMLAQPVYKNENGTVTLTLRNKVTDHKETIYSETLERVEAHWAKLNSTKAYFERIHEEGDANTAFYSITKDLHGRGIAYNALEGFDEAHNSRTELSFNTLSAISLLSTPTHLRAQPRTSHTRRVRTPLLSTSGGF